MNYSTPLLITLGADQKVEVVVIAVYLCFLVGLGFFLKGMNSNVSDYFRSGAKGTWWLVGMSMFISSVSAFTFTGNAGAVYDAGWTVLVIYWTQGLGLLICALFLGAWFRQLRAITHLDVIRDRFGTTTEQVLAYIKMTTFAFHGALTLYGLAIFSSATFGLPLQWTIVALGIVAVTYSTLGGVWAVMATDFVQSLVVIPVTIALAVFCLIKLGGVGEFVTQTSAIDDYKFLTDSGDFPATWVYATFMVAIISQTGVNVSVKFFSVKDGKSARKAALMAALLIMTCSLFWFIPSMTSRLLFSEEVMASQASNPAETAYAVAAFRLLPTGMMGLMIVAMFSATMSSMDTALNRNAAIVIRNIVPALFRIFKKDELIDKSALFLSRLMTMLMGVLVVGLALYYSVQPDFGMTKFYYLFSSIVALPVLIPFLLCVFIKRTAPWAAISSIVMGAIPSITSLISAEVFDAPWAYHERAFAVFGFGVAGFLIAMPFYKQSSEAYKARVDAFFERMHTPVNFKKEVGLANDELQLRMLGIASLLLAAFILLMLLVPNPTAGRLAILGISGFVGIIGGILLFASRRRREEYGGTTEETLEEYVSPDEK